MDFVAMLAYHVELNLGGWKGSFFWGAGGRKRREKTHTTLAIQNCLFLIIQDFVSSPFPLAVSLAFGYLKVILPCMYDMKLFFLNEVYSQMGTLGKFFHFLDVLLYLLGSHNCSCFFFGWMQARFTLFFCFWCILPLRFSLHLGLL